MKGVLLYFVTSNSKSKGKEQLKYSNLFLDFLFEATLSQITPYNYEIRSKTSVTKTTS